VARPEGTIARLRACGRELHYRAHQILTPDGVRVAAQDWGSPGSDAPALLLIHGFSQSHGAWLNQLASPLAEQYRLVSYDLRGHGESDKPAEAHFYREPARWAAEVQAVIDQLELGQPIAVAWSYAGRVILDYLGQFGDRRLAGLVMVNASSTADPAVLGPAGQCLRRMADPDLGVSTSATRDLLRACVATPLPAEEFDFMFEYNMKVPAGVRAHMIGRPALYEKILEAVRVPALVVHGALDPINLPAMAAFTARHIPGARAALYEDAAHMPFWESPQRFNEELAQFVSGATSGMT
jgi:pimeloyl-ACP methyl ester carboxylesterase